jgi:hypothetical protein
MYLSAVSPAQLSHANKDMEAKCELFEMSEKRKETTGRENGESM